MRFFWSLLIVFALAAGLGVMIQREPGYALFAYDDWTVEMPLWLAAIAVLVLILLTMTLLSLINTFFSGPRRIKAWWRLHQIESARRNTDRGLLNLTEGRWKKAEHYLSKGAQYSDKPLINYLAAARAATEAGSTSRRDRYLQLAENLEHNSDAVKLTAAELQYSQGDLEQSIATLQHLHLEKPRHPVVLKLLSDLYEKKGDWQSLFALLPDIRKADIFPNKEALAQFEQKVYAKFLPELLQHDRKTLAKFWHSAPRSVTSNPNCIEAYAALLHREGEDRDAEALIRRTLEKQWHDGLVELYGHIKGPSPKKQLAFAQSLLEREPRNAALFLTLARLCLDEKLWGMARDYLEMSIDCKPSAEAYAMLGQLMEQLGDKSKSEETYKNGLLWVVKNQPEGIQS